MKRLNRNDILLIGALILSAFVLMACFRIMSEKGSTVGVYVDGELRGEYELEKEREIEIDGYMGGRNVLVISGDQAYMKEASCPDGLCMHQGKVSRAGQSIVCLPNRVVVKISGGKGGDLDAVTQ